MIEVKTGDILDAGTHALVNTVNTVGIMGKGVALAFRKRFPDMFDDYVERCHRKEVQLGHPYPYYTTDGRIVINFPTKEHWRSVSRLTDIVEGLRYLRANVREWGVRSMAVPPLGCGNGQLEWSVVGPTLYRELDTIGIPVTLYAPLGTPHEQMQLDFFRDHAQELTGRGQGARFIDPAWVAIADVVRTISSGKHYWPVGRTRFQKIAYFLSSLGVPTHLEYERNNYGPYSPGLKAVESKLMNNGLITQRQLGKMMAINVGPTFDDARKAYADELQEWRGQIERVADLFARMSTRQTEVAASVHLVANQLRQRIGRAPTELEVREEVLKWKGRRRPPLATEEVESAIASLAILHWIDVALSPELHQDEFDEVPA